MRLRGNQKPMGVAGQYQHRISAHPAMAVTGHGAGSYRWESSSASWLLTVSQAARLQGFGSRRAWPATKRVAFSQVGNAVPAPLACHITQVVLS